MSDRGLKLVIQRIHDDPGFVDLVNNDPANTLGLYDLDDSERTSIVNACRERDVDMMRDLASSVGYDWQADHLHSVTTVTDESQTWRHGHIGDAEARALLDEDLNAFEPNKGNTNPKF